MNDNNPELSPMEEKFAYWREDPAINHLVGSLARAPDVTALEALLRSAFEAGWDCGFRRATE